MQGCGAEGRALQRSAQAGAQGGASPAIHAPPGPASLREGPCTGVPATLQRGSRSRTRADVGWSPWRGRPGTRDPVARGRKGRGLTARGGDGGRACVLIGWRLRARADQCTPRPSAPRCTPFSRAVAPAGSAPRGCARGSGVRPLSLALVVPPPPAAGFGFCFRGQGFSPLSLPPSKALGMAVLCKFARGNRSAGR